MTTKSYAVQLVINNSGEWRTSESRFASREEAAEAINRSRLLVDEGYAVRIIETSDPVSHFMWEGHLESYADHPQRCRHRKRMIKNQIFKFCVLSNRSPD